MRKCWIWIDKVVLLIYYSIMAQMNVFDVWTLSVGGGLANSIAMTKLELVEDFPRSTWDHRPSALPYHPLKILKTVETPASTCEQTCQRQHFIAFLVSHSFQLYLHDTEHDGKPLRAIINMICMLLNFSISIKLIQMSNVYLLTWSVFAKPYLHNPLIFNIDVDDVVYYFEYESNNTVDTNI